MIAQHEFRRLFMSYSFYGIKQFNFSQYTIYDKTRMQNLSMKKYICNTFVHKLHKYFEYLLKLK